MKKIFWILIGIAVMLQSCDSTYTYIPPQGTFETVDDFFEQTVVVPDTFTIDQSQENIIITEGKAEVLLEPCILALPDGTPLCSLTGSGPCPVNIELIEFYKNKDFVLNEMTTLNGQDDILATAGVFKLKATFADTILLTVAEGETFKVKVPKANTPTDSTYMELFSVDTTLVASAVWEKQVREVQDTIGFHVLEHDVFNEYFGAAYPVEFSGETTTLNIISAQELFDAEISRVYLLLDDYHSVLGTSYDKGSFVAQGVPVGEPVTVVALHTDGTQLYFASGEGVAGTDAEIMIELAPISAEALIEKLEEF